MHRSFRDPHEQYVEAAEEILMAHTGRPHQGTLQTPDAASLLADRPRHEAFAALRDRLNCSQAVTSAHLDSELRP